MLSVRPQDHAYRHQSSWWRLSSHEAAENADSFAQIVYQLSKGAMRHVGGGWREEVVAQDWWRARRRRR